MFLPFRRIRHALLEENKLRRYLTYALGEVLLIAFGILIALQLESWRQQEADASLERLYLRELLDDLEADIQRAGGWLDRYDGKVAGLETAKQLYYGKIEDTQDAGMLRLISYGAVGSRGQLLGDSPTFEDLVSTGNLSLLGSSEIKKETVRYYVNRQFLQKYSESLRSDYASYVNATYPFDPQNPEAVDPRDLARVLARFRHAEFIDLVNQELTYAHTLRGAVENQIADAETLSDLLNT
ncbi:MAG: hypothetical protein AAGA95_02245, partial [Pseudomonadota bacterium]